MTQKHKWSQFKGSQIVADQIEVLQAKWQAKGLYLPKYAWHELGHLLLLHFAGLCPDRMTAKEMGADPRAVDVFGYLIRNGHLNAHLIGIDEIAPAQVARTPFFKADLTDDTEPTLVDDAWVEELP
jgi:hypothetical protein